MITQSPYLANHLEGHFLSAYRMQLSSLPPSHTCYQSY